jgi:SulP family sulfate permease
MSPSFEPKLFFLLRQGYSRKQLVADLIAGLTVGIVALPLSIAFAIASGVKPEQGLYTAIIAGFVIAVLGGTRAQISGPTGAFIVILYDIVSKYGYDGLVIATLIAGGILIVMGALKMGALLKFIPYPVTVGFTSGIAVIIFSSQIRDFFGLQMPAVPAEFVAKWIAYKEAAPTFNWQTALVGLISLAIVFVWPRVTARVPGSLVAIVLLTIAVQIFQLPVETIGSRFGEVPNHLPTPQFPHVTWNLIQQMFQPGLTVALLAALESLLAAVVADGMMGTRHRSNVELIAQGAGNIASVLFGGIPATGAIARTAVNIKSGARTPVAAIIHSFVLLLILLVFGKYAALIPLASLAAILIYVAYNMSEWHTFVRLLKAPKSDVAVLLVTFLLTLLIDLTVAIQMGVLLAAFLFLKRMSDETQVRLVTENLREEDETETRDISDLKAPAGVEIFEIYGSLFFGAIEHFKEAIQRIEAPPKAVILRMRNVISIDASGLQSLADFQHRCADEGTKLIFSAVGAQPLAAMKQSGFYEQVGAENFCEDIFAALERAKTVTQPNHRL